MAVTRSDSIDFPEPAFRYFGSKHLLPAPADAKALNYLQARVLARPADLLSHTQRILLSHHLQESGHAFGALVDLFIATGTKCIALRRTLLTRCQAVLSLEQRAFLMLHLLSGLTPTTSLSVAHSVLTRGLASDLSVVSRAA